ncbi:MAG: adenylate kinase [Candidatus Magasanikbacteria bacterium]|nr:adenylate kinase [Candidatus Magasanikbacteria bacterium]
MAQLNIVLIGPQGSGKGTQAAKISAAYGIPAVSTGDLFRTHIQNESPIGAKIKEYINAGKLAPSELTNRIVAERLDKDDVSGGVILDGYPRDVEQLAALGALRPVSHVILLDLPDDVAVERLSARLTCQKCGAVYNTITNPPTAEGICDKCGGALIQRDDDKPSAIRERLKIYHADTEPVLAAFEQKGLVRKIYAAGSIDDVFAEIKAILGPVLNR